MDATEQALALPLIGERRGLVLVPVERSPPAYAELSQDLDEALIRRIGQRDEPALLLLLHRYGRLAFSIGCRILRDEGEAEDLVQEGYREQASEQRLMAALREIQAPAHAKFSGRSRIWGISAGVAAMLLLGVTGAFQLGKRSSAPPLPSVSAAPAPTLVAPKTDTGVDKLALQSQLAIAQAALDQLKQQSVEEEKQIAEQSNARTELVAQIADLTRKNQAGSESLLAVSQQRDSLQQQLSDASKSLEMVRADLDRTRQERQGVVLRVASLENEVNSLHATMAVADHSAATSDQLLARDRDIRELMGARQLYIADVFDVQNDGRKSRPYGRIFYTKGRSLLFYAFDLDAHPGYREAKAFQAWGKLDRGSERPVSLGIFTWIARTISGGF